VLAVAIAMLSGTLTMVKSFVSCVHFLPSI
jgi:hypothetical protein